MHHLLFWGGLVALGFGLGRIRDFARFVAKVKASKSAVVAEAKKV